MKAHTADSIYAFTIFIAIFLMLPFLFSQGEEDFGSAPVGEYSIEDEEKPEVFTRIIDRVSSFYGLKRKKKNTASAHSNNVELENSAPSAAGKAAFVKNNKSSVGNISYKQTESASAAVPQSASARGSSADASRGGYPHEKALLNGKLYDISSDYGGNKYVRTEKGFVPLKDFIAAGGRIVRPNYHHRGGSAAAGGGALGEDTKLYASYKGDASRLNAEYSKSNVGGKASNKFKNGKVKGFGGASAKNSDKKGSPSMIGISKGKLKDAFGAESQEEFERLKKGIIGGGSSQGRGAASSSKKEDVPAQIKDYKLEYSNPVGAGRKVSSKEDEKQSNNKNVDIGNDVNSVSLDDVDLGVLEQPDAEAPQENTSQIIRSIAEASSDDSGIIPNNARARKEMTEIYLGGKDFLGAVADGGIVKDPWILPVDFDKLPGQAFKEANNRYLMESDNVDIFADLDNSDKIYSATRQNISNLTNGNITPLVMIDGQKDGKMLAMPEDTYYYQVASNLLSNQVRRADSNGVVDWGKIDKNRVLVVVPERSLAENLRKDGYHVALFEKYIVAPKNLNEFYNGTARAVKGIENAKKEAGQTKQQEIEKDISGSFKNVFSGL